MPNHPNRSKQRTPIGKPCEFCPVAGGCFWDCCCRKITEAAAQIVEQYSLPTIQAPSMWLIDKAAIAADIRALTLPAKSSDHQRSGFEAQIRANDYRWSEMGQQPDEAAPADRHELLRLLDKARGEA